MPAATDRYEAERDPDHSTIGDSLTQYSIAGEAFTAGAQYALDRIVATIDRVLMDPNTSEYLTDRAADILRGIHAGELS